MGKQIDVGQMILETLEFDVHWLQLGYDGFLGTKEAFLAHRDVCIDRLFDDLELSISVEVVPPYPDRLICIEGYKHEV